MTPQVLVPALLVPLIGWRMYLRVRSHIGPQPVQPRRMIVRMVILSAVATAFLILSFSHIALLGAAVGGLALGGVIALVGVRLTRFQSGPNGTLYTPNAYIGVSITALLIGRIVYRFLVVMPAAQAAAQAPGANPFAAYQSSPLTTAMLMLTIGYYLTYFTGVLLKARDHRAVSA